MSRTVALLLILLLPVLAPAKAAAARAEIASEEDTGRYWQRANSLPPPAWPAMDASADSACINLAYFIDKDGVASNPILLRAWAPGVPETDEGRHRLEPFAQSAAITLAGWRFRASPENPRARPLVSNAVFLFARSSETDLSELRRHCLVGDLRDFLYQEQQDGYRRGNLNKGLIERRREEIPPMIPDGAGRHPGWID